MRTLLKGLQPALEVRPSQSHGQNDCLTDSILLALADQGLVKPLDKQHRSTLCTIVRKASRAAMALCHGVQTEPAPWQQTRQ